MSGDKSRYSLLVSRYSLYHRTFVDRLRHRVYKNDKR